MSHPAAALDVLVPETLVLAWSFEPAVVVPVVAAASLYLRGWAALRPRMPERFGAGRAVASVLATGPVRRLTGVLTEPRVAWVSFVVAFWAWHVPALYDMALRSDLWHHVEHACFFLTALLFWHPVILAWPARRAWPRWGMIAYLLLAEAQATLLSAILTFSDRVIYSAYAAGPGLRGLSPLEDQALAGVIMWVPGSLAFTLALLWLVLQALGPQPRMPARAAAATTTVTATNGSTATSAGQRS